MSAMRFLYSAFVYAALPLALARLYWRGSREPGYRQHVAERFARYGGERPNSPLIWLHAVSVGETRAAEPLVRALLSAYADHTVLLTHMTPTGRTAGESLYGKRVMRAYLPYDYPRAAARFLDRFRPRVGILMETEVWPNLVRACTMRGVPLCLVNARLSEKSARGYAQFASLARESFASLAAVAAQSEDDARRLRALGATRVEVTGNLKFDVALTPAQLALGRRWRAGWGARPVLAAASTRDGEEALLLDALNVLPADVLLVIVPRHPQRFDEVASLVEKRGVSLQRRSAGQALQPETRVLLGDSMGEMTAYYAACDIAFVGGSLLRFGGQNLIEACASGAPVLIGPHTFNFADAAQNAIDAGAALRIESADDLARRTNELLGDSERLLRMSARAIEFTRAHQGATERVMKILETLSSDRM